MENKPNWDRTINAILYLVEKTKENRLKEILRLLFVIDFENMRVEGQPITNLDWWNFKGVGLSSKKFNLELEKKNSKFKEFFTIDNGIITTKTIADLGFFSKSEYLVIKGILTEIETEKKIDYNKHILNSEIIPLIDSSQDVFFDYALAFSNKNYLDRELGETVLEQEEYGEEEESIKKTSKKAYRKKK